MDIANIPIVEFLKYCKDGARNRGYYWIVCILSRASDSRGLYQSIKNDWQSLDSITGKKMLVLFAGNEINQDKLDRLYLEDLKQFAVSDKRIGYIKRYNKFATFIGNSSALTTNLTTSDRYRILKDRIVNIEETQTDAIDSLRNYFGIEELSIPCLVYVPLYEGLIPVQNIVASFPDTDVDLYAYFKRLFNIITPLVDEIGLSNNELHERIYNTYTELCSHANKSQQRDEIMRCIQSKKYLKCEQPIRALLSRYVDLCEDYKQKYGKDYQEGSVTKPQLLHKIEDAFRTVDFPIVEHPPINAYISIGNFNRIKNSTIQVVVQNANFND